MKIAYLVVAHKNPLLLGREISTLRSADADFFVHLDRKSDIGPFIGLEEDEVIFLKNRQAVHWAGFSIVRAILALIQAALQGPQRYDYFVLLGASEYPLRSRDYIHRFFEKYRGAEFIDMVKLPNHLAGKPLSHVSKFCVESSHLIVRRVSGLISRLGVLQRDYRRQLKELEPYGGEMWWALSREACQYITDFTRERPEVVRFFQNVQVPDETFIQTILGNSVFAQRTRRNISFRDWSAGGRHPANINESHLALFEAADQVIQKDVFGSGEALFARKYSDADLPLLDRVDEMIARKEASNKSREL